VIPHRAAVRGRIIALTEDPERVDRACRIVFRACSGSLWQTPLWRPTCSASPMRSPNVALDENDCAAPAISGFKDCALLMFEVSAEGEWTLGSLPPLVLY